MVIMVCSLMTSYEKVKSSKMRIEIYRELIEALEKMTANLRFRSYDVYQLCEASFESGGELEGFKNITGCFEPEWRHACETCLCSIDQSTYNQFLSIGSFLGEYDLESQLNKLEHISSDIRKHLEASASELSQKKKIYYSLGLFGGMMICLMFI